jgi:hypothetical protein
MDVPVLTNLCQGENFISRPTSRPIEGQAGGGQMALTPATFNYLRTCVKTKKKVHLLKTKIGWN